MAPITEVNPATPKTSRIDDAPKGAVDTASGASASIDKENEQRLAKLRPAALEALKGSNMLDLLKEEGIVAKDASAFTIDNVNQYVAKVPVEVGLSKLNLAGDTNGTFTLYAGGVQHQYDAEYLKLLIKIVASNGTPASSSHDKIITDYVSRNKQPAAGADNKSSAPANAAAPAPSNAAAPAQPQGSLYEQYTPTVESKTQLFKVGSTEQADFDKSGENLKGQVDKYKSSGLNSFAARFKDSHPELATEDQKINDAIKTAGAAEAELKNKIQAHGESVKTALGTASAQTAALENSANLGALGNDAYKADIKNISALMAKGDAGGLEQLKQLAGKITADVKAADPRLSGNPDNAALEAYIAKVNAANAFKAEIAAVLNPENAHFTAEDKALADAQKAATDLTAARNSAAASIQASLEKSESIKAEGAKTDATLKHAIGASKYNPEKGEFNLSTVDESTAKYLTDPFTEKFAQSTEYLLKQLTEFGKTSPTIAEALKQGSKTDWKQFDQMIKAEMRDRRLNRDQAAELKAAADLAKHLFKLEPRKFYVGDKLDKDGKPVLDRKGNPVPDTKMIEMTNAEYMSVYYHFNRDPQKNGGMMATGHYYEKNRSHKYNRGMHSSAFGPDVLAMDLALTQDPAYAKDHEKNRMRDMTNMVSMQFKLTTGQVRYTDFFTNPAEALKYNTTNSVIQTVAIASSFTPAFGIVGTAARMGSIASSLTGVSGVEGFLGALGLGLVAPGVLNGAARMFTIRLGAARSGGGSTGGGGGNSF